VGQGLPRCAGREGPVARIRQGRDAGSLVEIQVYPASHGFNCDEIPSIHPPSADPALRHSFDFLATHLG
jgi:hypothetical protein